MQSFFAWDFNFWKELSLKWTLRHIVDSNIERVSLKFTNLYSRFFSVDNQLEKTFFLHFQFLSTRITISCANIKPIIGHSIFIKCTTIKRTPLLRFSIGKWNAMGHVSEEINAAICSRAHIRTPSTPAQYLPNLFVQEYESVHLETAKWGTEKEEVGRRGEEAKGDPRLSYVFARLFITVYYFLLSMESRIVGGRGGPRRISKTVSDRICIYRPGCVSGIRLQALLIAVPHCSPR